MSAPQLRPILPAVVLISLTAPGLRGQRLPAAIPLVQGTQVGETAFEPGDTPRGGNGQPVDGIEGSSHEMLRVHIHAHLSLFFKGRQIAIPYGIGIVRPTRQDSLGLRATRPSPRRTCTWAVGVKRTRRRINATAAREG